MIPKSIYTYWDKLQVPSNVAHCINSWRKLNPGVSIRVFSKSDAKELLMAPEWFDQLTPQVQADWVRLKVLHDRGGIWMDANIYGIKSVDSWVDWEGNELTIFGNVHKKDCLQLESWAFSCPPGHDFIKKWLEHTETIYKFGLKKYISQIGGIPKGFKSELPYFIIYLACFVVYHRKLFSDPLKILPMCTGTLCNDLQKFLALLKPIPANLVFYKYSSRTINSIYQFSASRGVYRIDSLAANALNMPLNPWPGRLRLCVEICLIFLVIRTMFFYLPGNQETADTYIGRVGRAG